MESNSIKKGFTLLESVVVLFLFVTAMTITSQIYINLIKAAILAQNFQLSLDNVRLGAEKVWGELKNGTNFIPSANGIQFLDRLCRQIKIYRSGNNLIYDIRGQSVSLFDDRLVEVTDFKIFYDNPSGDPNFYFGQANKIFILNYKVNLKTKTLVIPFEVWQTVAPSNSSLINNPCQ